MTKTYFKSIIKERNYFKNSIVKEHSSLIGEAEISIGLAYKFSKSLNLMLLREYKKTKKKLDGPSSIIPMIIIKNCNSLYGAYRLIKYNLINSSYSLIRSIFEGIQKNYVLTLDNRMARKLFEEDMGHTESYVTFTKIRKKLYQDDMLHRIESIYKNLSKKSHPSADGINNDNYYKYEIVEDVLRNISLFSYLNSISILEIYWDKFNKNEREKLLKWLSSFQNEYKEMTLTPNKFRFTDIHSKLT